MSYKTAVRKLARDSGELPHEFLLRITRGEIIRQHVPSKTDPNVYEEIELVPDLAMRVDAAKSVAPFFAPKLAVQHVELGGLGDLQDLSVDELQARLRVVMLQLSQVSPDAIATVLPQLTTGRGDS